MLQLLSCFPLLRHRRLATPRQPTVPSLRTHKHQYRDMNPDLGTPPIHLTTIPHGRGSRAKDTRDEKLSVQGCKLGREHEPGAAHTWRASSKNSKPSATPRCAARLLEGEANPRDFISVGLWRRLVMVWADLQRSLCQLPQRIARLMQ